MRAIRSSRDPKNGESLPRKGAMSTGNASGAPGGRALPSSAASSPECRPSRMHRAVWTVRSVELAHARTCSGDTICDSIIPNLLAVWRPRSVIGSVAPKVVSPGSSGGRSAWRMRRVTRLPDFNAASISKIVISTSPPPERRPRLQSSQSRTCRWSRASFPRRSVHSPASRDARTAARPHRRS